MLSSDDVTRLIERLPFWAHLSEPQKDYLQKNTNTAHFSAGSFLHNSETDCIGILFLKTGMLRIYITSDVGKEVTLYRLEAGDVCVLSASCLLQGIDFDISITAETDCDILQLQSAALARLSAENVYVELFTYKTTAERFSDVMWTMKQILFSSFDQRLADFLLEECTRNHTCEIRMTQEQIARNLGSAREVVSRMLRYFAKEGLVTVSRGEITILDAKKLRDFCK
ncbi:MAG: Crp/Fnr family transcriptional regulator [Lachnospiraceae bacterium]|nr:Crp/Fnr family transcriptional regulator [Lachnospiraceae bacterium]